MVIYLLEVVMISKIVLIAFLASTVTLAGCKDNPVGTALVAGAAGVAVGAAIASKNKHKYHKRYYHNRYYYRPYYRPYTYRYYTY